MNTQPLIGRIIVLPTDDSLEIDLAVSQRFSEWTVGSLIHHVTNRYHRVLKENIVIVYKLAQKVFYRHNENHPELSQLAAGLFLFFNDLLFQFKMEDEILFPNITQLIKEKGGTESTTYSTFGLIRESALVLQNKHKATIEKLKLFRRLTSDYKIPPDACKSYETFFEKMKAFENDLILYINLENNILFPRAIKIDEVFAE